VTAHDDERVRESYENIPYPSSSNHYSHPDRLATLALLHGLDAPPPEHCRVLELGCADGGNLIAMAFELADSQFVGIDLSPRQIDAGRAEIARLGLRNVELHVRSILDLDPTLGTFDYVICHGVFSWVTESVQEKIFAICETSLAPNGVAYISYNTFPGWHLRRMLRDMMRYHIRDEPDLGARVERALELVRFLAESSGEAKDAVGVFLRDVRTQLDDYRDRPSYFAHEYLEETNAPLYFHEFAARAAAHRLQYLSEAEPELTQIDNLPDAVAGRLREYAADRIETEQYVDFVLNRTFRRTLLCREGIALDTELAPERMTRLHASTTATLVDPERRTFRTERNRSFETSHPLANEVLVTLASIAPRAASFAELANGRDADAVAHLLHSLFWSGIVELHVAPPQCTNAVSARPRATALARRQAEAGVLVTNQHRRVLKLDDAIARFLLPQLDGTRTRDDLVRLLDREVSAARLDVSADGQPIREPQRIPSVLQAVVEYHLRRMAELALLVG
jgi:SAM-dependent methyltransferase/methyltransferase-like protein